MVQWTDEEDAILVPFVARSHVKREETEGLAKRLERGIHAVQQRIRVLRQAADPKTVAAVTAYWGKASANAIAADVGVYENAITVAARRLGFAITTPSLRGQAAMKARRAAEDARPAPLSAKRRKVTQEQIDWARQNWDNPTYKAEARAIAMRIVLDKSALRGRAAP